MGARVEGEFELDGADSGTAHLPATKHASSATTDFSPELLGIYYSRLFPFELLHSWLSYDPSSLSAGGETTASSVLSRREFSTTVSIQGDEIYKRYQSFVSRQDLAAAIRKQNPLKIDIGAVFNHAPKDHKSLPDGALRPVQRELVFDVDLTDYDPVRNCGCSGAALCAKCWKFMVMAMEVMDRGLRDDFGFEHLAWVYSGRRGVHCWVCDEGARGMGNEARGAVAGYFEVALASEKNKNQHLPHPMHPMLTRAHKLLEPHFISDIIPEDGHGLLATQASWTKLLLTLPEAAHPVSMELEKKWRKNNISTPAEKWEELKASLSSFSGKSGTSKAPKHISNSDKLKIEHWPVETVFKYTYPRLDINVSKGMNHLLKSPFCVHPKTGRVCVPIDMSNVRQFDPLSVPTLGQLMMELDAYKGEDMGREWQKTSLRGPFEHFEKHFLVPLLNDVRKSQREEREKKAAVAGDF